METLHLPAVAPKRRGSSPWGQIQEVYDVIPGVWFVTTASHGGVYLSPERREQIPPTLVAPGNFADQRAAGWYEEDVDWCIPYVAFESEIAQSASADSADCVAKGNHRAHLANWHPDAYEAFFGVELKPGESSEKDERRFYREHAQDWLVLAAWGEWHAAVPAGYVGVVASLGGKRGGTDERYFLVDAAAYQDRGRFAFVVDPARDSVWVGPGRGC